MLAPLLLILMDGDDPGHLLLVRSYALESAQNCEVLDHRAVLGIEIRAA